MRNRLMHALLSTVRGTQVAYRIRDFVGSGEVTALGGISALPPASLRVHGSVAGENTGSFTAPTSPVFLGEQGVFRSSAEPRTFAGGESCPYLFDTWELDDSGYLRVCITLFAPYEGAVTVYYGSELVTVSFPAGSCAGDSCTVLFDMEAAGNAGNRIHIEPRHALCCRITVCGQDETKGKRLTLMAKDAEGNCYSRCDCEVSELLRAIPGGTADMLDYGNRQIIRCVGDLTLSGQMLTETVAQSVNGDSPCFALAAIDGRDCTENCIFSHGVFSHDLAQGLSGAAPGLYASDTALYLAIPHGVLGETVERSESALLEAARRLVNNSEMKIWYALDQTYTEALTVSGRLRMAPSESTVRAVGGDARLIELSVYCRKEA